MSCISCTNKFPTKISTCDRTIGIFGLTLPEGAVAVLEDKHGNEYLVGWSNDADGCTIAVTPDPDNYPLPEWNATDLYPEGLISVAGNTLTLKFYADVSYNELIEFDFCYITYDGFELTLVQRDTTHGTVITC